MGWKAPNASGHRDVVELSVLCTGANSQPFAGALELCGPHAAHAASYCSPAASFNNNIIINQFREPIRSILASFLIVAIQRFGNILIRIGTTQQLDSSPHREPWPNCLQWRHGRINRAALPVGAARFPCGMAGWAQRSADEGFTFQ